MDTWTTPSTLEWDIIGAVYNRPNRWVRANITGVLEYGHEPKESVFEASSGRKYVTKLGEDDLPLSISCGAIDRATKQMLEEFRRQGTPVYVYPSIPGTPQAFWPLRNGVGGDPADLVYTGAIGNVNSTLYLIEADTRSGYYFRAVDPSTVQIRGSVPIGAGQDSPFCMGRGAYLWKDWTNRVKNSLFGDLTTYIPANWTAAGGTPGTDCGVKAAGVFGVPTLYMWGTGISYTSAWFNVTAATIAALSFVSFTDGSMTVEVDYDNGTSDTTTVGPGTTYTQKDVTIAATASKARLIVTMSAGTWGEFGAPQVLGAGTGLDNSFTPYFIGSFGSGTVGEVDDASLTLTGQHYLPQGGANVCLAVMGYWQPGFGAFDTATDGPTNGLCALENTTQGSSISLEASNFSAAGLKLHVRQGGTIKGSSAAWIQGVGMSYAWMLMTGWTGTSTYHLYGAIAQVNDAPAITEKVDVTASVNPYTNFDKIDIGRIASARTMCDGIIGGVCVATIPYADKVAWLTFMANRNYTDLWRNHYGRQYRILMNDMSPLPWNRQIWRGTIHLEQVREL